MDPPQRRKILNVFDFLSPVYYPLLVAILAFGLAPLLERVTPGDWFTTTGRFTTLDGLRGLLALSVFIHHSSITHVYLTTGQWMLPDSPLYARLGSGGVGLFFFLTGYLFFRLFAMNPSRWNARLFFRRRFFRLAPAFYLATVATAITCLFLGGGFVSDGPEFAGEILSWATFGLPYGLFQNINSQPLTLIVIAGVIWSIRWEWIFYLVFPWLRRLASLRSVLIFLAIVASARWLAARVAVTDYVVANPFWEQGHRLISDAGRFFVLDFGVGMVAAYLSVNERAIKIFSTRAMWVVAIAALVAEVALPVRFYSYALESIFLGLFFVQLCLNPERWKILESRHLRLLGDVSYGVYLYHGLNLFWIFSLARVLIGDQILTNPVLHWALALAAGTLTLLEAYASYRWIEKPLMRK